MRRFALIAVAAFGLAACGGGGGAPATGVTGPAAEGFELRSGEIAAGGAIPARLTCDGDDASPELAWGGLPGGTATLALVFEDRDAPGGTFTHWLVWSLPPTVTSLPANVPPGPTADAGDLSVVQGTNTFGNVGYGGPCPPDGEEHRYAFRLLALDAGFERPDPASDRAAFDAAVEGHVIAEARLEATYARGS